MNEFQTGAVRDIGGKGRMDLLPMCALLRISKHMEDAISPDPETGKSHYPERNWEQGIPMHSMIDSAMRHLVKYMDGQTDEDHLCAAATNLLMALWTEEKLPGMQDIPSRLSPVASVAPDETPKVEAPIREKAQRRTQKSRSRECAYYMHDGRCIGTKEFDPCPFDGDHIKCLCAEVASAPYRNDV